MPSLRGGGAERIMVDLANAFAHRGFNVDLVIVECKGPYLKYVSKHVRIVDLGCSRVILSLPALVNYIRKERPQAILSALKHANIVAVLAKKIARGGSRLVVSERNLLTLSSHRSKLKRDRLLPLFMRYTYPMADGIVAVSKGVADDLSTSIGLPHKRIKVIYNPIDAKQIEKLSRLPAIHPWFESGQYQVIISMGRLTAQKDFRTLIRAFAKIKEQRSVRLIILGEGELRSELKNLCMHLGVDDKVDFPGFMDNPYSWIRNAALFVLSSAWEGLPGALIQAMACGTRVVSTDCPSGPAEILENGRWGRLVSVGDVETMANAMLLALDDPRPPDVLKRAQDFSAKRAIDSYLSMLGI